jgi:cholestenol delta-isomerase
MIQSVSATCRAFQAVNDASRLLNKAEKMGYYKKKA